MECAQNPNCGPIWNLALIEGTTIIFEINYHSDYTLTKEDIANVGPSISRVESSKRSLVDGG